MHNGTKEGEKKNKIWREDTHKQPKESEKMSGVG